ncbi:hypothetical protein [Neobacillus vireti]|uniref:hypothetical protein n=1 Tax=Neobacillus vireti TaxID=220686 RepID=UPI003000A5D7
MTDKKKSKVQEPVHEEALHSTEQTKKTGEQDSISTLDILWEHAFRELDQWAKRADFRDDVLVKEAMYFADGIKRNQENIISVKERFNNEIAKWERTAREEFLMSTTALQHLFPKRSYEEVNQQIDQIKSRTSSILGSSLQIVTNNQMMDQYLQMIDKYIAFRKKGRKQYIESIKQAATVISANQKRFVDFFSGQIKGLMFPLNNFMETVEEEDIKS